MQFFKHFVYFNFKNWTTIRKVTEWPRASYKESCVHLVRHVSIAVCFQTRWEQLLKPAAAAMMPRISIVLLSTSTLVVSHPRHKAVDLAGGQRLPASAVRYRTGPAPNSTAKLPMAGLLMLARRKPEMVEALAEAGAFTCLAVDRRLAGMCTSRLGAWQSEGRERHCSAWPCARWWCISNRRTSRPESKRTTR